MGTFAVAFFEKRCYLSVLGERLDCICGRRYSLSAKEPRKSAKGGPLSAPSVQIVQLPRGPAERNQYITCARKIFTPSLRVRLNSRSERIAESSHPRGATAARTVAIGLQSVGQPPYCEEHP